MPLSPSGIYTLPNGYLAVTGQDILPSNHNPPLEDIGSVLSQAFYRTGVAPMLADLNFNTFKGVGLANGTVNSDAVNLSQLNGIVAATGSNKIKLAATTNNGVTIQYFTQVINTDAGGAGVVNFPTLFTSIPFVIAVAGDGNSVIQMRPAPGAITISGFSFLTIPAVPSAPYRVNWLAIGPTA